MRWAGHVARMGEGRNVYRVSVGKPEGKRPLGRTRRRWEDGIKIYLRGLVGVGCGAESPGSGYGPLAGCCGCGDEPSGSGSTELVRKGRGGFHKENIKFSLGATWLNACRKQ
jgi:hypothetical protein